MRADARTQGSSFGDHTIEADAEEMTEGGLLPVGSEAANQNFFKPGSCLSTSYHSVTRAISVCETK